MSTSKRIGDWHADGTYETMLDGIRRQVYALGLEKKWKYADTAYVLATVKHETGGKFRPIKELLANPHSTNPEQQALARRQAQYAPYYGRGFVQLTWRRNYEKYSSILDVDLVSVPDRAEQSDIALFILIHGMWYGNFTTVGLNDFTGMRDTDFVGMRKIVNGLDRANLIAGYADKFLPDVIKHASPLGSPVVASPIGIAPASGEGDSSPTLVSTPSHPNVLVSPSNPQLEGIGVDVKNGLDFIGQLLAFHPSPATPDTVAPTPERTNFTKTDLDLTEGLITRLFRFLRETLFGK